MYSWVEWLRYQITMGQLVPESWDAHKPFPYKGLLISAIYFHEANRTCAAGDPSRAWHIVAMAYYHLGLNTTASTLKNTSRAAQIGHAGRSEKVRSLVMNGLDIISREGTAASIEQAKDQVIALLRKKNKGWVRDCLNEFDTLVPEKTKGREAGAQKNDVLDRIRNLLDTWALPSGPYPQIAESFSRFNTKMRKVHPAAPTSAPSEFILIEEKDCIFRHINLLPDDYELTMHVSRSDSE